MSWIVPSIAAEMWGISLEQVIQGIQSGSIPSRNEHGFVFVRHGENDAPEVARVPTAFAPVPAVMQVAAAAGEVPVEQTAIAINPAAIPAVEEIGDRGAAEPAEIEHDGDDTGEGKAADHDYLNFLKHSGDWQRARREAAKLRHPPFGQAKAA
jgi:hypothetical protein